LQHFQHREKVVPIYDLIKVDDQVPGCPIIEKTFCDIMDKYLKEFGVA
jgi:coenzyme F420-reducing hydrogenase gamma subunit